MAVIVAGSEAINRSNYIASTYTVLTKNGPADGTGPLDTFQVYVAQNLDGVGIILGTAYGSDLSWTTRDSVDVGVPSVGLNTYEDLSVDCELNDLLAWYSGGSGPTKGVCLDRTATGGSGYLYKSGNQFGAGTQTYTLDADDIISIYATGETVAVGTQPLKNVLGRPFRGCFR